MLSSLLYPIGWSRLPRHHGPPGSTAGHPISDTAIHQRFSAGIGSPWNRLKFPGKPPFGKENF
jgi:hypothetical protein